MSHVCVSKLSTIGSDNGRGQAIIWTDAGLLLIGQLGTNFDEVVFKKMDQNMSSGQWGPFCIGLNGLNTKICVHFWAIYCKYVN